MSRLFWCGVERFCKEAGFDAEDRQWMGELMRKIAASGYRGAKDIWGQDVGLSTPPTTGVYSNVYDAKSPNVGLRGSTNVQSQQAGGGVGEETFEDCRGEI